MRTSVILKKGASQGMEPIGCSRAAILRHTFADFLQPSARVGASLAGEAAGAVDALPTLVIIGKAG
ncbi:hypothetical protein [Pseudomonas sp. RIT623]|uniref:hypothetical protein n=1 Tax=Pseudomonas sp. RIT623 TaxID=2559075 RepID=UPI00106F4C00|nr:hypothetical protein [Pseudomonas sp. RIT623]TFF36041.1 hypothetical protein E3U47_20515 [Pseudomonas sp. RIT623]